MTSEVTDPEGLFYRAVVTSITPQITYLKRYVIKMIVEIT